MIVKDCNELSCPFCRRFRYNIRCVHPGRATLAWPRKTTVPPPDCPLRKEPETVRLDDALIETK
jgi:hypothetical protein